MSNDPRSDEFKYPEGDQDRAPEWSRADAIATLIPNGGVVIACEKKGAATCAFRHIDDVEGIMLLAHVELVIEGVYNALSKKTGKTPAELREAVAFARKGIEPHVAHAARIKPAPKGDGS